MSKTEAKTKIKYLSLFSGIEAATVAWQPLGWECVAVAEIEKFPCALLAHYYPDTPNLGDVTKITENDIKNLGPIDLVVFGSPCQDLSVAGNQEGLDGDSSKLFYEAIRIIEYAKQHCGCRFALWENVPGVFSSNKGEDFTAVVRALSTNRDLSTPQNGWGNTGITVGPAGFVEWRMLDAQYFGLPQRRKRVFAVVDFGNYTRRSPILLEPKTLLGITPSSREKKQTIATNATRCTKSYCLPEQSLVETEICPTLKANNKNNITSPIVIASTIIGRDSKHGGNGKGFDDSGACYTLTAIDRHAVAFNTAVRRITPKEAERLQGFPDEYTKIMWRHKFECLACGELFTDKYATGINTLAPAECPVCGEEEQISYDCPDGPRYKALGNSMAVPVMRWIGEKIQKALAKKE